MKKNTLILVFVIHIFLFSLFSIFFVISTGKIIRRRGEDEKNIPFSENDELLLSTFNDFSDSYECIGACVCEEEEENYHRRSSSGTKYATPLRTGLSAFLVAVSTYSAMNIAKKRFEKECEQEFAYSNFHCSTENIRAEVEQCEKTDESEIEPSNTVTSSQELGEEEYSCFGNCIDEVFQRKQPIEERDSRGPNFCLSLELERMVTVFCTGKTLDWCNRRAKEEFDRRLFSAYCRKQSLWIYHMKVGTKGIGPRKVKQIVYSLCTSSFKQKGGKSIDVIECSLIRMNEQSGKGDGELEDRRDEEIMEEGEEVVFGDVETEEDVTRKKPENLKDNKKDDKNRPLESDELNDWKEKLQKRFQ